MDARTDAEKTLRSVTEWSQLVPLIALVDLDQAFAPEYPYGCYLQDHTTVAELGSPLFELKLRQARSAYFKPLQEAHTGSPHYALFQEVVDHSSDWVLVKDLDHRFLLASQDFARTAGFAIEELIGMDDLEIGTSPEHVYGNSEKNWQGFWPQDDAVTSSGQIAVEENPHWDLYSNQARYRRTIRAPLRNHRGDIYGLLVCSQDVTEHKRNESLLEERTEMLAQVTDEKRRSEINRQRAEEAVAAKTKFLAAASHDLRQPLHAIGLFLDILNTQTEGKPEQQLVRQIQQSCNTLNNLFNGCLDISRLDAGVVERTDEDFRLPTFLNGLHHELMQQAREKGLQYIYTCDDSVVRSDSMLLGRIFRNLANNAIQNTDSGAISVTGSSQGDAVTLAITDTGKGIPEGERNRIFSEFHQVDSEDAKMGRGLGLGLAIVKRLCELLAIDISLESTVGQGSTFTLRIPHGLADNIVDPEEASTTLTLDGTQVLIIDDDRYIRHGMETLLQACGCQTISAADTSLAMTRLRQRNITPSIIVADYHLSNGRRGTAAIREIRDLFGQNIPAVLVTGDTTADSEKEAARHELHILHKPVSSDLLLSTIASSIAQGSLPPLGA